jgi:hypothetical protein
MSKYHTVTFGEIERAIDIMGGLKVFQEFLSGEYTIVPSPKKKRTLADYWTSREGLRVYDTLAKYILPITQEDGKSDVSACHFITLSHNMYDRAIIEKYLKGRKEVEKNAFTLNQIGSLLNAQWDGENGPLLVHDGVRGATNVFYCMGAGGELCTVSVCRSTQQWEIAAWPLKDESATWPRGSRIFYNKSEHSPSLG